MLHEGQISTCVCATAVIRAMCITFADVKYLFARLQDEYCISVVRWNAALILRACDRYLGLELCFTSFPWGTRASREGEIAGGRAVGFAPAAGLNA